MRIKQTLANQFYGILVCLASLAYPENMASKPHNELDKNRCNTFYQIKSFANQPYLACVHYFETGEFGEKNYKSSVEGGIYRKVDTAWVLINHFRDSHRNGLESIYIDSTRVIFEDINKDLSPEFIVWYELVQDGLDDDTRKMLIYHKGKKYAIRGHSSKLLGNSARGVQIDKRFKDLPKVIQDTCISRWNK